MKLKKELSDLYDRIRITDETQKLKDKREILQADVEGRFPDEMKKQNIALKKSDIEIFDQGSYKYNTTIKAPVIDRDVAVKIPLNIEDFPDPRKIKTYLYDALDYVAMRTVSIKEPCVNVAYFEDEKEWMHIDMPLYAEHNGKIYLARGKKTGSYSWEPADPKGLNEDLCSKINGNDQLRRIIRFIKKWKLEQYANTILDHQIPPSIGLTYLAYDNFVSVSSSKGDDDLSSLKQTMEGMLNCFTKTYEDSILVKADITRKLPVEPYSDIFQKMKDSSKDYGILFYTRLSKAVENLSNALKVENEHDAGVYLKRLFGSDFDIPPKQTTTTSTENKKEHSFG